MDEHLYIITYDVCDQKRWRRVFKLMNGYGEWLQLSVFQCRLSKKKYMQLKMDLDTLIKDEEDHVLMLDIGPADGVKLRVTSIGKAFQPVEREPIIV